jgi:hypothetical protein
MPDTFTQPWSSDPSSIFIFGYNRTVVLVFRPIFHLHLQSHLHSQHPDNTSIFIFSLTYTHNILHLHLPEAHLHSQHPDNTSIFIFIGSLTLTTSCIFIFSLTYTHNISQHLHLHLTYTHNIQIIAFQQLTYTHNIQIIAFQQLAPNPNPNPNPTPTPTPRPNAQRTQTTSGARRTMSIMPSLLASKMAKTRPRSLRSNPSAISACAVSFRSRNPLFCAGYMCIVYCILWVDTRALYPGTRFVVQAHRFRV